MPAPTRSQRNRPNARALILTPEALLWGAFFALYAMTTARDVLPADSGEFQLAAARWGIPHPPGYPLYTVIGALWVWILPFGHAAYRLNLLSAVLAATSVLLLFKTVRTWCIAWHFSPRAGAVGGLAAALLLGSATTFWAQATIANIRMPTLLFVTWGFWALAKRDRRRQQAEASQPPPADLLELALVLGLGVGHHPSLAFVALGWGCCVLLREPRLLIQPRRWWKAVPLAALAWLIPQLYLPLRSTMPDVALSTGNLLDWDAFWSHVLARGFGGDMFAITGSRELWLRARLLPSYFRLQFPALFLTGIALSWLWLIVRKPKLGLSLLLSWGCTTFTTITYRAPQTVEYLAPAYVPMALAMGLGVAGLARWARARTGESRPITLLRRCVIPILMLLLLVRLPLRVPDFAVLAADTSIRARTASMLEAAPPGSLILADWHWATAFWVLQADGLRPDVEVAYVYPVAGRDYEDVWRTRAEEAGERPLFSTHSYPWAEWTFAPAGGGFRLYRRPLETLAPELGFTPLESNLGSLRLLGYRWVDPEDRLKNGLSDVRPGQQIELQLAWQATGPQEPAPSFTARLWTEDGALLAQGDRNLGSDTAQGEIRFTQITLQLPVDHCSGTLNPQVSVYTVSDGQFQDLGSVSLPQGTMACLFPTLPVERAWPGAVLPRGPFLRGIDYDVHGTEATAYLHWCGPGQGIYVTSKEQRAYVFPLAAGRCQSVRLTVPADSAPQLTFSREDGVPLTRVGLPLPKPRAGERYAPFGDAFVLVGSRVQALEETLVVDLDWRTARPIVEDYAVNVRLFDENRSQLAQHDMQPALGTFPTLKWIVRDTRIRDTHTFSVTGTMPASVDVTVYERFRITPVLGPGGDVTTLTTDRN